MVAHPFILSPSFFLQAFGGFGGVMNYESNELIVLRDLSGIASHLPAGSETRYYPIVFPATRISKISL